MDNRAGKGRDGKNTGTYTKANGDTFVGTWVDGYPIDGVYTWKNGDTYKGKWVIDYNYNPPKNSTFDGRALPEKGRQGRVKDKDNNDIDLIKKDVLYGVTLPRIVSK